MNRHPIRNPHQPHQPSVTRVNFRTNTQICKQNTDIHITQANIITIQQALTQQPKKTISHWQLLATPHNCVASISKPSTELSYIRTVYCRIFSHPQNTLKSTHSLHSLLYINILYIWFCCVYRPTGIRFSCCPTLAPRWLWPEPKAVLWTNRRSCQKSCRCRPTTTMCSGKPQSATTNAPPRAHHINERHIVYTNVFVRE